MNLNFFKGFVKYVFLFFTAVMFGQKEFQGRAYYDSKTTIDISNLGGGDISEDRKREIAARMESNLEKSYVLTFNQVESLYTEAEQSNTWRGGRFRAMMEMSSGPLYKNVKEAVMLQEQELLGKKFLVKGSLPKYAWTMTGETKQIGNYMCFMATTKKIVPNRGVDFGRPSRTDNEDKKNKEVKVVAWYTMQIPVNQGPDDYWGLPGLILELNADRTIIFCTKIVINSEDVSGIEKPSKGKEISKADFQALVRKKMKDMRYNVIEGRRAR